MATSKRIVFATGNKDKVKEALAIMADSGYDIISMKEIGISVDVDENGETYTDNARIKARAVAAALPDEYKDCIVMSDDSGFEVDYLNKEPGVHSARFMGEDTSYTIKNQAILDKLKDVPMEQRTARFCCAVVCVLPDGTEKEAFATYEGAVAFESRGTNGFGYDPIFWLPELQMTDGELSPELKNQTSHRGKALRMMRNLLA